MGVFSLILYIIIFLNTIAAVITVFREPREIAATWGWLIVLVMLPVLDLSFTSSLGVVSEKNVSLIYVRKKQWACKN